MFSVLVSFRDSTLPE